MNSFCPRLLIRADASPTIGTGHVMRCLALGQAWQKMGGTVHLMTRQLPGSLHDRLRRESIDVHPVESKTSLRDDAESLGQLAESISATSVVIDGYSFDAEYQARVAGSGARHVLTISDAETDDRVAADAVLNQNAYAHDAMYDGAEFEAMTGPRYALLRREFQSALPRRIQPRKVKRLLVCFGGGDEPNLTSTIMRVLDKAGLPNLSVDIVLGQCNRHVAQIEALSRQLAVNFRLHRNVDRISALMRQADLAITAGGSTCYELAALGVPALVLPIAENQRPVARALERFQVAQFADCEVATCEERLLGAISELASDVDRRQRMSDNGRRMVDGQGAIRVARALMAREVRLRPATSDDTKTLWIWRNDARVRAASFIGGRVDLETHRRWLERKIASDDCQLLIAETTDGRPIGQTRFDRERDESNAVISISIAPNFRGRGLAPLLIAQSVERIAALPDWNRVVDSIVAFIKPDNTASQRSFESAGFEYHARQQVNGKRADRFVLSLQNRVAVPMQSSMRKAG